ncbi:MAG: hypothetical protein ACI8VW_002579 [bacterium]|jgi:hypothetical protein
MRLNITFTKIDSNATGRPRAQLAGGALTRHGPDWLARCAKANCTTLTPTFLMAGCINFFGRAIAPIMGMAFIALGRMPNYTNNDNCAD